MRVRCSTVDRVECPVCCGRGTTRGRAFGRTAGTAAYVCGLCRGHGVVSRAQIAEFAESGCRCSALPIWCRSETPTPRRGRSGSPSVLRRQCWMPSAI